MANILLAWELGGGLGHLSALRPVAAGLVARGHRVFAALRDLSSAARMFAGTEVSFLQAPFRSRRGGVVINPLRTFPHILLCNGFADPGELQAMADAWRNLYDYVQPDLIVFDHSPTALLAAQSCPARRALIGTGFCAPADVCPMPDLRPWLPDDSERMRKAEQHALDNANRVLQRWGTAALERISQLYGDVDENFLMSVAELDTYRPGRNGQTYWGSWPDAGGVAPEWPAGDGKRVFAYLKPFPALPQLLALLIELRQPALLYIDGIDPRMARRFQSPTLRFERRPVDLRQVAQQCDLAILNGTHGTTVSMLLAGRPLLEIPLYLEQGLNSRAVERLGAGLTAAPNRPEQIAVKLMRLLGSDEYATAARRFAAGHGDLVPDQQVERMLLRIEELLA